MPSIEAGPGWPTWFHTKSSPPKAAGGAAHDRAGEIVLAQIADQALRTAAGGGDLADDGIDPGLVDVDDADRRPFAGKAQRTGPSHPGSRRGDDADLAFEPHGYPPSTLAVAVSRSYAAMPLPS